MAAGAKQKAMASSGAGSQGSHRSTATKVRESVFSILDEVGVECISPDKKG